MSSFETTFGNVDGLATVPDFIAPHMGCPESVKKINPHWHGYPSYMERALERAQLDRAIRACAATYEFLYGGAYTPTTVTYQSGTRPLLEQIVATVCKDAPDAMTKLTALLHWRRDNIAHVPVCGLGTEEEVLLGGYGMCHDAARTLITLCHVAGISGRIVLGLNETTGMGHTLAEVYVDGKWILADPSAPMPFAFLRQDDGFLASAWDVRCDSTIPQRCRTEFVVSDKMVANYGSFFVDYRLVNYPLEVSNRYMARRFVRLITGEKILQNYDYKGHVNHPAVSSYIDLDEIATQWIAGTMKPTPRQYHRTT